MFCKTQLSGFTKRQAWEMKILVFFAVKTELLKLFCVHITYTNVYFSPNKTNGALEYKIQMSEVRV